MSNARGPWTPLTIPSPDHGFVCASGNAFDDIDPTTQDVVASVRSSTVADVAQATERAQRAFAASSWRNDGAARARVLFRYSERLRADADRLAELLSREQGKTLAEARGEVFGSAGMIEYYAGLSRALYGRAIALGDDAHGVILREPLGVVAVITPWNWPLTLLMRSLAPALAAGNAVVVKPASLTSAVTVTALALLAADPDLPEGVLTCVLGSGAIVGDALVRDPRVEMVAFTGESGTGVGVMRNAADDLRKVSLELGGKSPNLVFADAHLDKALDGALNAIFTTSGQICTAGSRLLVEASIYDSFVDRLVARTRALRLGDPLDPGTTMAPLVSRSQQQTVNDYIDLGKKEGSLLTGGDLPDDPRLHQGCFVAPAIIAGLAESSRLVQEEIFGPVLVVHPFASEDEGIAMAENTKFGLAAGIWTSDLDRAWRVGRALRSGTIWINTYHHFYAEAEVGGFRRSGLGRQQGLEGIAEFTETKHLNFDSRATLW